MEIFGVILGAFLASLFGVAGSLYIHRHQAQDQRNGIIGALYGEISVLAELVDIDADIEHVKSPEDVMRVTDRLLHGTAVFDNCAGQLGLLPDSLPSKVVRFYGRLKANVTSMRDITSSSRFFSLMNNQPREPEKRELYEGIRQAIKNEADVLLQDLVKYSR